MKAWAVGLLAVFIAAIAVSPASATPTLRFIVDGGAPIDCADGAACDGNAAPGVVGFNGGLGPFDVNVVTGATKPVIGGADNPNLLLDSINVQSTAAGPHSLVVLFSEVSFTLPTSFKFAASGTGGFGAAGSGSNVTFTAFSDALNTLFGTGSLIGVLGPFDLSGTTSFSATAAGASAPTAPYSLTGIISLNTSGTGSWSGELALVNTPEPGTLLLLGSGLLGITVATWRRRGSK